MGQTTSIPHSDSLATRCPVDHTLASAPTSQTPSSSSQCPVEHSQQEAQCPVQHINPQNQMPNFSQTPAHGQVANLPVERTLSSIPRPAVKGESSSRNWDYPSPQQFHNALVRKGWETPEEHVETMVDIHNFLNEKAWEEVLRWEKSREGARPDDKPELTRFMGRPGTISPKARIHLWAGWLFPSKFNTEPPFDRHDWVVRRPSSNEEVRYVIDYYSAPEEEDGSPVFSLDVRPALDSWGSTKERIRAATSDVWDLWRESARTEADRGPTSPKS